MRKIDWREEKIEKIKKFAYLECTLQKNGGQEAHVKKRLKERQG